MQEYVCEGDFDQGRLCMFEPALCVPSLLIYPTFTSRSVPFGPFVAPQWAAFVPYEMYRVQLAIETNIYGRYGTVVPWVMQNRGNFDVFVHPNTGFEREDHHDWGMWYGNTINRSVTPCSPHRQDGPALGP